MDLRTRGIVVAILVVVRACSSSSTRSITGSRRGMESARCSAISLLYALSSIRLSPAADGTVSIPEAHGISRVWTRSTDGRFRQKTQRAVGARRWVEGTGAADVGRPDGHLLPADPGAAGPRWPGSPVSRLATARGRPAHGAGRDWRTAPTRRERAAVDAAVVEQCAMPRLDLRRRQLDEASRLR